MTRSAPLPLSESPLFDHEPGSREDVAAAFSFAEGYRETTGRPLIVRTSFYDRLREHAENHGLTFPEKAIVREQRIPVAPQP